MGIREFRGGSSASEGCRSEGFDTALLEHVRSLGRLDV